MVCPSLLMCESQIDKILTLLFGDFYTKKNKIQFFQKNIGVTPFFCFILMDDPINM